MNKPKILVIVGQTASGKSALAVKLARKFNGEVISADSRQVYKGLDIGTGKITEKEMKGVSHHLLDIVSPKKTFTVADFKKQAQKKIKDITKKKRLPIVCGGTGFYIDSLVYNMEYPEVPPNPKLRKELGEKSTEELYTLLKEKDIKRAEMIDSQNPVRLIRALEIVEALGKVPLIKQDSLYDVFFIGIERSDDDLKNRINKRIRSRLTHGMIQEAETLHREGLSWKRMRELGLEYRFLADYCEKIINKKELVEKLEQAIWQYAKRQKTWFKKNKDIVWIDSDNKEIEMKIKGWINK